MYEDEQSDRRLVKIAIIILVLIFGSCGLCYVARYSVDTVLKNWLSAIILIMLSVL